MTRDEEYWCPTKVGENDEAIEGFWGRCVVEIGKTACDPNWQGNSKFLY